MPMTPRLFTLAEARSILRTIRPLIAEILEIHKRIVEQDPGLWAAMQRSAGNGGSRELSALSQEFARLDRLVHDVLDSGVEIRDLGAGLIDFPARLEGRAIYLCWKFDEVDILYWHDTASGFAGRTPIDWS